MNCMIKLGSIVKHKNNGYFGTVEYSSFGYSIHTYFKDEKFGLVLGKTIAMSESEVLERYDLIEKMPEGYEIGECGGLIKI